MLDKSKLLIISASYTLFQCSVVCFSSDFQSPRSIGLGGSGHAAPLLNDSIFLNPSFASFLPTYSFGANYLAFSNPDATSNGKYLNFSVQDGRSELFQAGAAYTQRVDGTFIHIGASKSFVHRFGFGLGGKFFFNHKTFAAGRDANISTTAIVSEWLQAAAILDNVFETQEGLNRGLYREMILGLKFNINSILMVYLDPHYTPSLPIPERKGFEAGVEFVFMSDLYLRLGYYKNATIAYEATRGRGFGAGVGFVAPRLSIDYGFSRVLEPALATAHTIGATVYF